MNFSKVLFNPFEKYAGTQALLLGIGGWLLASVMCFVVNCHFDGVIDVHFGNDTNFLMALTEGALVIVLFSFLLYLTGLMASKSQLRYVDFLGTTALARVPYVIAPLFGYLIPESMSADAIMQGLEDGSFSIAPTDIVMLMFSALLTLSITVWVLVLLYRAFSISANLKGTKAIVLFIAVVLVAEILVKVILNNLFEIQLFDVIVG
jgi:hypothetical protein